MPPKAQSRYVCQSCGEVFLRWEGQCRACGAWTSLVETVVREPALLISAPVLLVGMAVALGIGLLQAITQVQDQTVSFVPKIVGMVVALTLTLPWVLNQMLQHWR